MIQINISTKQKQTHRYKEQTCGCRSGVGRRKDWEFGISRGKLLYTGWINNKVLLYSTGNYIQYPVTSHNGKEYEKTIMEKKYPVTNNNGKEYIYIYIYIYTHTHTTHTHIYMRPGPLCCSAAVLVPGHTSPRATKYKGSINIRD